MRHTINLLHAGDDPIEILEYDEEDRPLRVHFVAEAMVRRIEYTLVYEDADGESVTVELASGWDAQDSSKLFQTDDDEFIGTASTIVSVSNGTVTKCVCLDGND